jgi:hypothetical protein
MWSTKRIPCLRRFVAKLPKLAIIIQGPKFQYSVTVMSLIFKVVLSVKKSIPHN